MSFDQVVLGFGVPMFAAFLAGIGYLLARLRKTENNIVELQTKMLPFWSAAQTAFAEALHKPDPHFAGRDTLIEQLENLTITPEGRLELEKMLKEQRDNDSEPDAAKKAGIMLDVMPMVLLERAGKLPTEDQRSISQKKQQQQHL